MAIATDERIDPVVFRPTGCPYGAGDVGQLVLRT